MNVNEKGNLGLIKVLADLYSRGYYCFTPFDDYSPVDCIAMGKDGKTFRIQVKYRSPDKFGRYEILARSVVNGKSIPINKSMIDCWAVYAYDIDKVLYFPLSKMGDKKSHYIKKEDIDSLGTLES